MDFNEYQKLARESARLDQDFITRLSHWALGLAGETGEIVEPIKKYIFYNTPFGRTKMQEELGDLLWYLTNIASEYGLYLDEIAEYNIKKLKKRYPEGFKEDH